MSKEIQTEIETWLEKVVIGLNLCPFAALPFNTQRYRIIVSSAINEEAVLHDLYQACHELQNLDVKQLETTLLVLPNVLQNFLDFNQFLDLVDALLEQNDWFGIFQIATFHPQYQFANTQPDDAENLTNRAPYPILHILREASMEQAVANYEDPASIPERNIQTMQKLSDVEKQELFPYLADENEQACQDIVEKK